LSFICTRWDSLGRQLIQEILENDLHVVTRHADTFEKNQEQPQQPVIAVQTSI